MTTTIDHHLAAAPDKHTRFRIAYTLNNMQPVACTIISDQPLFYIDYECAEEDEFDEFFDFTAVEKGVETLRENIIAASERELSSSDMPFDMPDTKEFSMFMEDMMSITKPASSEDEARSVEDIAFIESILSKSRLAASYIKTAKQYGTKLTYNDQVCDAAYDRHSCEIQINPQLSREDKVLLAARELRRVWQHRQGGLINPVMFHPDNAVLVNRIQKADVAVNMVRIAWELQLADEKGPWDRLEKSSLGDLARAFARESALDFRSLNNGDAASAVFETWFLSDRCRFEDRVLIQQMLSDYRGYVFENIEASKMVTADLLIALGSMPFGKNYLAPYVNTLMSDALFTEVRDRSNANFLWFIKFERTFRETEHELQGPNQISHHDIRHDELSKNDKKRFGDNDKTTIISLPTGRAGQSSLKSGTSDGTGRNVIAFSGSRSGES